MVIELVLGKDLVRLTCLDHGEGTVPGREDHATVHRNRRTAIGLAVKPRLIELLARERIEAKNRTVLFAEVDNSLVDERRGDVGGSLVGPPKFTFPSFQDQTLGLGKSTPTIPRPLAEGAITKPSWTTGEATKRRVRL